MFFRAVRALVLATVLLSAGGADAQPVRSGLADRVIEARVSELVARLALTQEQVTAVRGILAEARSELAAMRTAAPPGPDRRDARQAILWRAEDRIWALLTCTQKDAYRILERERHTAQLERLAEERPFAPRHGRPRPHRRPR
jgi:hypothetical protein